jgi:phosphoglycerate dehydrogenase-like enzyme
MAILVMTAPIPADSFVVALREAAPDVPVWTSDEPHDPLAVEAILAWRIKPGVVGRYPNLRVVSAVGAGVEKLLAAGDLPAGLPVTRALDPAQNELIAQWVVGCTLQFTRELRRYAAQQAAAHWERHPVRPAAQCRVGVLGLGAVGQAIARAFRPLGYPVAGWARHERAVDGVAVFAGEAGLPALLAQTDVLVCALPLTPQTRGLLNRTTLAMLPRGALLVSVGRGEHVVETGLRALLDEGHLAGAALDVFEREPPPPDNWVWSHPKVLATPHIAGEVARAVVARQTLDALRRARAGEPQPLAVDRQAGY